MTKKNNIKIPYSLIFLASYSFYAVAQEATGKFAICNDYATVGTGLCRPEPTPAPVVKGLKKPDPVKEFLDNHGKPPREFAEFYLNPTPENAQRWAQSFRAQQVQAAKASQAWREALQGFNGKSSLSSASLPAPTVVQSSSLGTASLSPQASAPTVAKVPQRLGAFATPAESRGTLTYYFSALDPFSTRMKPDLQGVMTEKKSKYKFTCVDLTPLSPQVKAQPQNRAGLSCDWRLPQPGEVQSIDIQQTPVILVARPGQPAVRKVGLQTRQQLLDLLP